MYKISDSENVKLGGLERRRDGRVEQDRIGWDKRNTYKESIDS